MIRNILIVLATIGVWILTYAVLGIIIKDLPMGVDVLFSTLVALVYFGAKFTDNNGRASP